MPTRQIRWNKTAVLQFEKAINYIAVDSLHNAQQVQEDILHKVRSLLDYPEINSPDKFKLNNDGKFRAFELHRYRVAYHVSENEIRILRLRHTSMDPKVY